MSIHQLVKDTIKNHKQEIELIQWAIMNGISSLFYSQYISKMKHKEIASRILIHVPSIKNLLIYLKPESKFMEYLSNNLIKDIGNHQLIKKYFNAPELVMFKEENIEIMKFIYDLYISSNITKRIPETISKKFGLNDDTNQTFCERWEINIFDAPITNDQYEFIIDQTVLQLLMLLPSIKKEVEILENRMNILMENGKNGKILTIENENAICPIHFTPAIVNNESVIDLLTFVTNTSFKEIFNDITNVFDYTVTTGLFNQVTLTRLKGIET